MMKTVLIAIALTAMTAPAAFAQATIAQNEAMPAKGSFTVGQVEDADVIDSAGQKVGEVEHVLLDAAGKPDKIVIEIDRRGPDRKVVVALADITVAPEPGDDDDYIVRTRQTKAQLLAMPEWRR